MKMINQIYINSSCSHILCVIKSNTHIYNGKGCVILLPGFSQSASDLDYFMSSLSNELNDLGFTTIQVNLFGHGDSYGELEKLDINIIEDNILSVYRYVSEELCVNGPIIGVARGIYGNVLCNKDIASVFNKIICVNPVMINTNQLYVECFDENEIEINDNKHFDDLLQLMGAELSNLRGQKVNSLFLCEIIQYIKSKKFSFDKSIIITSYNDFDELHTLDEFSKIEIEYNLEFLAKHCFKRDVEWQFALKNYIIDILKDNENESTVSD